MSSNTGKHLCLADLWLWPSAFFLIVPNLIMNELESHEYKSPLSVFSSPFTMNLVICRTYWVLSSISELCVTILAHLILQTLRCVFIFVQPGGVRNSHLHVDNGWISNNTQLAWHIFQQQSDYIIPRFRFIEPGKATGEQYNLIILNFSVTLLAWCTDNSELLIMEWIIVLIIITPWL
jgi:hypothetical protein